MHEPIHLKPHMLDPNDYVRMLYRRGLVTPLVRLAILGVAVTGFTQIVSGGDAWVFGLTITVFVIVSLLLVRRQNLKAVVSSPLNRFVWATRNIAFADGELYMSNAANARSQIPYGAFVKFEVADPFYLIYLSAGQFIVIPKSAFAFPEDERRFLAIFSELGLATASARKV